MRVGRVWLDGVLIVAALDADGVRPAVPSTRSMREFIEASAEPGPDACLGRAAVARSSATLAAPIDDPRKIVGIGLNYRDHAVESGEPTPVHPLVFAKFPGSIVGPEAPIRWSGDITSAVDFEAELAIVIGRRAKDVAVEAAGSYIFGYTCLNDISARDLQFADGQWVRGKSLDTFCPVGPWIVTRDELGDAADLDIECRVNGEALQSANTGDMLFGVPELVSTLSRSFTLEPGDLIATGTPPGVGWFRQPRRLLRHGDEVVVSIEGIGDLRNRVEVYP